MDHPAQRASVEILQELEARPFSGAGGIGPPGPPGPASAFVFAVYTPNNADLLLPNTDSSYVVFTGLLAMHTLTLPAAPATGEMVVVKDGDGSLATQDFVINGNGKNIDGVATYTMTLVQNGLKGSVSLIYSGTAWGIV